MTRGPAQAGNRASRTGRYLQWWDTGPECNAVTPAVCKVHDSTLIPNCLGARTRPARRFQRPQAPMTVWPSGLRRWLQAPVRKGVGSNPTAVTFAGDALSAPAHPCRAAATHPAPACKGSRWAEARIKIARMTLTIKLDGNWSSFQLANSAPPLSVTDSAIAPSARIPSTERLRMLRRATQALCTRQ